MSDFTISKIEPQKKNKNRFSIFSHNEFKIGVSADTLLQFDLQIGKIISPILLQNIQEKEDHLALKNSAMRFLARRPHSRKELTDKLILKSKNRNLIDQVIHELDEQKYLDDEAFAEAFLTDEIRLKKTGPLLIKNKLLRKGIKTEIIDSIIENEYPESEQTKNCTYLAEKKLKSLHANLDAKDKKNKIANYLKQKGYHWEIVKPVLDSLLNGEEYYE